MFHYHNKISMATPHCATPM